MNGRRRSFWATPSGSCASFTPWRMSFSSAARWSIWDQQHGSDMIESAALGKATIVGPFTANFADAMQQFLAADAMVVVPDAAGLEQSVVRMLEDPEDAATLGRRAARLYSNSRGPPSGTCGSFLTRSFGPHYAAESRHEVCSIVSNVRSGPTPSPT